MKHILGTRFYFFLYLLMVLSSYCGALSVATAEELNLALGRPCTFYPKPSYGPCTDKDDPIQLTDGKSTNGKSFWTSKGTVGWQRSASVIIAIDLEKVESIGRISFTSAAGRAGVYWPSSAEFYTSEDGQKYQYWGDILKQDIKRSGPLPNSYQIRRFVSDSINVSGRYVRIVFTPKQPDIWGGCFIFTDEIEILRGSDPVKTSSDHGRAISSSDGKQLSLEEIRILSCFNLRYEKDRSAIRGLVQSLAKKGVLSDSEKEEFLKELDQTSEAYKTVFVPKDFDLAPSAFKAFLKSDPQGTAGSKILLPFCEEHAQLMRLQAKLWRKIDKDPIVARRANCWEPGLFVAPMTEIRKNEPLDLLMGEDRFCAWNLYNTTDQAMKLRISLPDDSKNITPYEVLWTDTADLIPVESAFLPIPKTNVGYITELLPGVVKQIWFSISSKDLPAGDYQIAANVRYAGQEKPIAISLPYKVWPITYPAVQTLQSGGWDYSDKESVFGLSERNRDDLIRVMKEYRASNPWGTAALMLNCRISKESGELIVNTKIMEDWLKRWPDAKQYYIFLNAPNHFLGQKMGTPQFNKLVGQWAKFWDNWFRERKIDPKQVYLLVRDEPRLENKECIPVIIAWSRAIRQAVDGFPVWEEPSFRDPSKIPRNLIDACDVICPNRVTWYDCKDAFEKYYLPLIKKGKRFHFYSCSGPTRLLDSYYYFLLQSWDIFRLGGDASFFWAFVDSKNNNWNEYEIGGVQYSQVFIDIKDTRVVPSRELMAMKIGVQDYETLHLLKKAIEKAERDPDPARQKKARQAKQVLTEGVELVQKKCSLPRMLRYLQPDPDRDLSEQVRRRLLEQLLLLDD